MSKLTREERSKIIEEMYEDFADALIDNLSENEDNLLFPPAEEKVEEKDGCCDD